MLCPAPATIVRVLSLLSVISTSKVVLSFSPTSCAARQTTDRAKVADNRIEFTNSQQRTLQRCTALLAKKFNSGHETEPASSSVKNSGKAKAEHSLDKSERLISLGYGLTFVIGLHTPGFEFIFQNLYVGVFFGVVFIKILLISLRDTSWAKQQVPEVQEVIGFLSRQGDLLFASIMLLIAVAPIDEVVTQGEPISILRIARFFFPLVSWYQRFDEDTT